jgi:signal transduction histidine kinase
MKNRTDKKTIGRSVASFFLHFFSFFALIAFVVTCSVLLFLSGINFTADEIRAIAPPVFFNVILLSLLFVIIDFLRRRATVHRPVKKIQRALERLGHGDFSARVEFSSPEIGSIFAFSEIAESINLLAEELSGLETLRSDFIANVSHELKTPLAVIQNYGTMLTRPDLSEAERIEYARAITESSRRLAALITNILKLNKLENQQIFPSTVKYDLGEQLCECLLQFEGAWEKKNLEIRTDIEEDVVISSDPELLSLVWSNLFSNAVKFTDEGGEISVSLKRDGDQITVCISDTGCGMTAETGAHIFEKFYQGDTSHTTQGNGLGLALVKKVVDIVHGEISVESVYGQGSTFTVRFGDIYD